LLQILELLFCKLQGFIVLINVVVLALRLSKLFFLLVTRGAESIGWPYTAIKRTIMPLLFSAADVIAASHVIGAIHVFGTIVHSFQQCLAAGGFNFSDVDASCSTTVVATECCRFGEYWLKKHACTCACASKVTRFYASIVSHDAQYCTASGLPVPGVFETAGGPSRYRL
jgi:hypothetical protein